jgi:hypothetical protein
MARKAYKSYLLPTDFNEMEKFIIKNKELLSEKVLDSIEYALKKKLNFVEVFKFTNSDFIIVIPFDKFKENIDNIYNYYIKDEKYELCPRVKKIENNLSKTIASYEKKQKE